MTKMINNNFDKEKDGTSLNSRELLFGIVNNLSYPVILLSKKGEAYTIQFCNELMSGIIAADAEERKSVAEESTEAEKTANMTFDKSLHMLLERYDNESEDDSFSIYNVDMLDKTFNVHFSTTLAHIMVMFVEIQPAAIFTTIPYKDVSNSCSAIMVILDEEGSVVDTNDHFVDFVGLNKDEIIGKKFFNTFIPSNQKKLQNYFEEIDTCTLESQNFTTPLKASDESVSRIGWQVSKKIVKNDKTYLIAVGNDVSKLVEKNRKLQEQITSVNIGFDYFPYAIAYINDSGKFTVMNPRFKKMFGIKKDMKNISFNNITTLKRHNTFEQMQEYIKLIKEMHYIITKNINSKAVKLKVDIRLLDHEKTLGKMYIIVIQALK